MSEVARVAEPMQRCASDTGWYGATRVSVYAGTADDGFYEPVVQGGADSCERIKAWWDQITQAEAQRISEGRYPCEHGAAYNYHRDEDINGPALLAGCWPRLLQDAGEEPLDDPAEEAARLRQEEGYYINPPNHPPLVEALYSCYRDALMGPPAGWTPTTATGEWVTVILCHAILDDFGPPVRYLGVTPECAAWQFAGVVEERKARGWVSSHGGNQYAGDFSWANCETHITRQLPETMLTLPFAERCSAVIDLTAATYSDATDTAAQEFGLDRADYIAETKAMYCEGSRDHLRNYPQFHGEWVASWLPPDGSICFEAALLNAARTATYGKGTRAPFC